MRMDLRRKLKDGVMEKALGLTSKPVEELAKLEPYVTMAVLPQRVAEHVAQTTTNQEPQEETFVPATVPALEVPEKAQKGSPSDQDMVEQSQPSRKLPDKVVVEHGNTHARMLADMINGTIDRVAALDREIVKRDAIIEALNKETAKDVKTVGEAMTYIEQLNLALIALPDSIVVKVAQTVPTQTSRLAQSGNSPGDLEAWVATVVHSNYKHGWTLPEIADEMEARGYDFGGIQHKGHRLSAVIIAAQKEGRLMTIAKRDRRIWAC